jgi:hypothetical protein
MEFDSVAQPVKRWKAWVVEQAMPLDQFLRKPSTSNKVANGCAIGTIRSMLHAAKHGHTMSDNAMFNFGVLQNEIVIIAAGARHLTSEMSKGEFNQNSMRKLWGKLLIHVNVMDLAVYQDAWQKAGDMVTARATFDALWAACHELVLDWGICSTCDYWVLYPELGPLCSWCVDFNGELMGPGHWWCAYPNKRSRTFDFLRQVIMPQVPDKLIWEIVFYAVPFGRM